MATVIFYGTAGCVNSGRLKELLQQAGHEVVDRDLLLHPWTGDELRSFFGALPVSHWFDRAAPRIRSGEFDPGRVDADTAIRLMLLEPVLIRRPLLQVGEERRVGFERVDVDAWIGLGCSGAVRVDASPPAVGGDWGGP